MSTPKARDRATVTTEALISDSMDFKCPFPGTEKQESIDIGVILFLHNLMDIDSAQITIKDTIMQVVTVHGFMSCQGANGTRVVTRVTSVVTVGSTPCHGATNTQIIAAVSATTCHGVTNMQAVNLVPQRDCWLYPTS